MIQQQAGGLQERDQAIAMLCPRFDGLEADVDMFHSAEDIRADIVR